jgi:UDPglucose 6-dehydrogenase
VSVLVVGSGVVGHATGVGLQQLGHEVSFADIDEDRIALLRADGLNAIHVAEMDLGRVRTVFVCVPTPSTSAGIDLSSLDDACKTIGAAMQTVDVHPLIVFRSTVPPGTTRRRLIPHLQEASGRTEGRDFDVCFNPEYLRARNAVDDFLRFRFVTIGTASRGDGANLRMRRLFANFHATFADFTFEQAEFQKYVHNLFNATKISFFNEMRRAGTALGLEDVEEAFRLTATTAESIWNPLYGVQDFGPYGGACLPKDTVAWLAYASERQLPAELVSAVHAANEAHKEWRA